LLGEIVLYVHTHKTPEEASRIETESIEMFKNVDVANGRKWEDRYLDNYYLNLALRLMQDGKAEMGNRYLKLSLEQAEKEQARREEEAKQRGTPLGNTSSSMASLCWRLAISGEIEKAAEIANRYEPRYYMPYVHLAVAEKYVAAGEPEKAKKALKKAVEIIPKIDVFYPGLQDDFEKMAKFAVEFDDKKGFYEIMDIAIKIGEKEKWFDESGWMLRKFIRHLAEYGDKDHPLFEQTEKYADGFKDGSHRAEIYLSLGVSRAMLGDHDNARRLLKKGLDQPLEQYRTRGAFCAAIIEARSYENKR
jgi:tetratricopeptide (TPR) repeat protein